jgi:hypothetical protein
MIKPTIREESERHLFRYLQSSSRSIYVSLSHTSLPIETWGFASIEAFPESTLHVITPLVFGNGLMTLGTRTGFVRFGFLLQLLTKVGIYLFVHLFPNLKAEAFLCAGCENVSTGLARPFVRGSYLALVGPTIQTKC